MLSQYDPRLLLKLAWFLSTDEFFETIAGLRCLEKRYRFDVGDQFMAVKHAADGQLFR